MPAVTPRSRYGRYYAYALAASCLPDDVTGDMILQCLVSRLRDSPHLPQPLPPTVLAPDAASVGHSAAAHLFLLLQHLPHRYIRASLRLMPIVHAFGAPYPVTTGTRTGAHAGLRVLSAGYPAFVVPPALHLQSSTPLPSAHFSPHLPIPHAISLPVTCTCTTWFAYACGVHAKLPLNATCTRIWPGTPGLRGLSDTHHHATSPHAATSYVAAYAFLTTL